jgi:hypothetical protein
MQYTTFDVRDKPLGVLKIFKLFNKNSSCHVQDEDGSCEVHRNVGKF